VWDITSGASIHIEAVHRLSELGAVFTYVLKMTSHEGFDAEVSMIMMFTVEGDLITRVEVFDEADLEVALARFEELHPQSPRLENAASRVYERFVARWVARDWDGVSETLADNIFNDDRRRVVNAGLRHGRDATIASMRASAALGVSAGAPTVVATRGERLVLNRECFSIREQASETVVAEVLGIVEIDADERIVTRFALDLDDFDTAVAELDARYVAGEAAPYARTWSVIAGIQAAVNRRELPATTPDPAYIDHRPLVSIEGVDLAASIRALFDIFSAYRVYVEEVHRLDELGAVYTQVHRGTSHDGVDAEWRMIELQTVEGDLLSHVEVFDEEDLDAALVCFDELHPRGPGLENAASRAEHRFFAYWGARNWAAMADILTGDSFIDDSQRNAANVGFWDGRDVVIANLQALADVAAAEHQTLTVIATRGERLVLTRRRSPNRDPRNGEFVSEGLIIAEIDTDDRIKAHVQFDPDDVDTAFEELDARYIAGEAAPYASTWSVMARACAVFNRGELPATTPDSVFVDHRPILAVDAVDLPSYLRVMWDLTPDIRVDIEAVHRLSELGAVLTHAVNETSPEGFNAEWRGILIYTLEADMVNRCEVFDEADLAAALARFDELDATL
jgi:hypothetical protein